MKKALLVLTIAVTTATFFCPNSTRGQLLPPAKKAAHVEISEGPELESTHDTQAIIRWTSSNPGGSDEHFAVLHYGTDPNNLNLLAKSHIRLNRQHSYTVFRVRALDLKPHTTYYYKVDSEDAKGRSDGVTSPVKTFTTQQARLHDSNGNTLLSFVSTPVRRAWDMVRTGLGLVSVNAADYVASVVPDKSGIVGGDELLRYRNEFACRDTD